MRTSTIAATILFAAVAAFVVSGAASISVGNAASLNLGSQNLTPYRTCTITATPAGTTAVIDAVVRQATATTNLGTQTTIEVSSANNANRRTYVKFDLSGCTPSIPSSGNVRNATLRLYATAVAATCRTVDIFRVTAAWTEAGITWNNQPFGTTLNNPATGSRSDSVDVGSAAGCTNTVAGYVSGADVTTDVVGFRWGIGDEQRLDDPRRR